MQTRDAETGWCYKNGGQPLFGYKTARLVRGEERRGRPIIKSIWLPDDTVVNGKPMHVSSTPHLAEALVELTDIENRCQHLPELGAIWTSIDAARKLFEAEAAIGPEGD